MQKRKGYKLQMTPSQQCKAAGLAGLQHLADLSGVPRRTLVDWCRTRPEAFRLLVLGAGVDCGKVNIINWIPVDKGLPPKMLRVLAFDAGGFGVITGRFQSAGWYLEGNLDDAANITHWASLSEIENALVKAK